MTVIAAIDYHGLGLTDVVIIAGVLALVLREIADFRGWSRSSRTLRVENTDLLRRNAELEASVIRLDAEVADLKDRVRELQARDQAAVLAELKLHETGAEARTARTLAVLDRILDRLQTVQSYDGNTQAQEAG